MAVFPLLVVLGVHSVLYRSYFNPQPSVREIMDSVSNFLSGPSGSLKSGAICKCQFTVEFRMDACLHVSL